MEGLKLEEEIITVQEVVPVPVPSPAEEEEASSAMTVDSGTIFMRAGIRRGITGPFMGPHHDASGITGPFMGPHHDAKQICMLHYAIRNMSN